MIRAHAAAVRAAIDATQATVYDPDEVPNLPPTPYTVAYVDQGRSADTRLPGDNAGRAWRVVIHFIGSTADEARWAAEQTWSALDNQRLPITGRRTTPCRSESTQPIGADLDDDSIFTGSAVWTFASHPA